MVSVLQAKDASDMAMKEITHSEWFSAGFPKKVLEEANALEDTIDENELTKRKDYRIYSPLRLILQMQKILMMHFL